MRCLLRFAVLSLVCVAGVVPAQAQELHEDAVEVQEDFYWRTSRDAIVHWATGEVRMPVDPALEVFYGPGFREALEQAAAEWSVRPDIPLIVLDYAPSEADREAAMQKRGNWIGLAHSWDYADELAITVSTSDAASGSVMAAQVWLNARRPLAVLDDALAARGEHYDLQGVLTHEFGHVLGLGEGPSQTLATMNPNFRRGETHQRTVDFIDENAVTSLYDQVESVGYDQSASCSLGVVHGAQSKGQAAVAGLVGLCAMIRRARKRRRVVA